MYDINNRIVKFVTTWSLPQSEDTDRPMSDISQDDFIAEDVEDEGASEDAEDASSARAEAMLLNAEAQGETSGNEP
eukprot:scaffold67269_cov15-Prasinocladus_malaysianus.AAC.1